MANFEETSIGLFQTPAEEIYTLAKNQAGMGKLVSNSSGENLHYKESSEILANGRFQTPAERIYTITNDDLLEEVLRYLAR